MFNIKARTSVFQLIVDDIIKDINIGKLKEGDFLAGELELAAKYDVSRNTVREALRILESYGLIETGKRKFPRVINNNIKAAISIASIHVPKNKSLLPQIQQLRVILESGFCEDIINNATQDDINALIEINEQLKNSVIVSELAKLDFLFHERLMAICDNVLVQNIYTALASTITYILEIGKNVEDGINEAYTGHKKIIKYIKEKNFDLLHREIEKHFDYSKNILKEKN